MIYCKYNISLIIRWFKFNSFSESSRTHLILRLAAWFKKWRSTPDLWFPGRQFHTHVTHWLVIETWFISQPFKSVTEINTVISVKTQTLKFCKLQIVLRYVGGWVPEKTSNKSCKSANLLSVLFGIGRPITDTRFLFFFFCLALSVRFPA